MKIYELILFINSILPHEIVDALKMDERDILIGILLYMFIWACVISEVAKKTKDIIVTVIVGILILFPPILLLVYLKQIKGDN